MRRGSPAQQLVAEECGSVAKWYGLCAGWVVRQQQRAEASSSPLSSLTVQQQRRVCHESARLSMQSAKETGVRHVECRGWRGMCIGRRQHSVHAATPPRINQLKSSVLSHRPLLTLIDSTMASMTAAAPARAAMGALRRPSARPALSAARLAPAGLLSRHGSAIPMSRGLALPARRTSAQTPVVAQAAATPATPPAPQGESGHAQSPIGAAAALSGAVAGRRPPPPALPALPLPPLSPPAPAASAFSR